MKQLLLWQRFLPWAHGRRGGCKAWPRGEGEEQGVHGNMPLPSIEEPDGLKAKQLQGTRENQMPQLCENSEDCDCS